MITQSIAIARFLAKKANLYGKDDVTQARADMVVDYVTDFNNSESNFFISPDSNKVDLHHKTYRVFHKYCRIVSG